MRASRIWEKPSSSQSLSPSLPKVLQTVDDKTETGASGVGNDVGDGAGACVAAVGDGVDEGASVGAAGVRVGVRDGVAVAAPENG